MRFVRVVPAHAACLLLFLMSFGTTAVAQENAAAAATPRISAAQLETLRGELAELRGRIASVEAKRAPAPAKSRRPRTRARPKTAGQSR